MQDGLEHLIVPKSKEVLRKQNPHHDGDTSRVHRCHLEEFSIAQEINQQNKVIVLYNPKYKMNIHESILR